MNSPATPESEQARTIYVWWADDGHHIRKWSHEPFAEGETVLALSASPTPADIQRVAEAIDACGNDGRAGWDWWQNEARAAWFAVTASPTPPSDAIELDMGMATGFLVDRSAAPAQPVGDDAMREALVGWRPMDRDSARVALWRAISAIKLGNPTDDKLILENLRTAGVWLYQRTCVNHPDRPFREHLDGDDLCQECCDAWARGEAAALDQAPARTGEGA